MSAIYNEIDPFAARWLRNLITAGHIASGVVDERSVADLVPADVAGLGQRHFFAGIAGWSLALRLAGVPDDADVWTGSCPCQGLSDAGKRLGFADERHLWPEWFRLIRECRPAVVFGEQVASGLGWSWLDLVFADLEGAGYACAAANLPAASVGAPHRRQRLLFVAYADRQSGRLLAAQRQPGRADAQAERSGEARELAVTDGKQLDGTRERSTAGITESADRCDCGHGRSDHWGGDEECTKCSCTYWLADAAGKRRHGVSRDAGARREQPEPPRRSEACDLGDASFTRSGRNTGAVSGAEGKGRSKRSSAGRVTDVAVHASADGGVADAEATGCRTGRLDRAHGRSALEPVRHSHDGWRDVDWIPCSDGVARPVEPGTHPLAYGVPGRVGLLRGYGNAIVPEKVAAFIVAALEAA